MKMNPQGYERPNEYYRYLRDSMAALLSDISKRRPITFPPPNHPNCFQLCQFSKMWIYNCPFPEFKSISDNQVSDGSRCLLSTILVIEFSYFADRSSTFNFRECRKAPRCCGRFANRKDYRSASLVSLLSCLRLHSKSLDFCRGCWQLPLEMTLSGLRGVPY